jgi:hypothetical protein
MNKEQRRLMLQELEAKARQQAKLSELKKEFAQQVNKQAGTEVPQPLLDIFLGAMLMELPRVVTEAAPHKEPFQKIGSELLLSGIGNVLEAVVAHEAKKKKTRKR